LANIHESAVREISERKGASPRFLIERTVRHTGG
jgi:hypothetical protein